MSQNSDLIETWADIEGYEGLYQVSTLGRVRSLDRITQCTNCYGNKVDVTIRGKLLRGSKDFAGYLVVMLYGSKSRTTCKVHRLVAKAFISNPENKPEVNHIDGDKSNNYVDNLEWVTGSENKAHAYSIGLSKVVKVRCIDDGQVFNSMTSADRYYHLGEGCVWYAIKTGKPTHGLTFEKIT